MASGWKKILDKIGGASAEGPYPSDWEAMNAKIDAHPELSSSKKGGAIWWTAGIVLVVLLSTGTIFFWPDGGSQPLRNQQTSPEQVENTGQANNLYDENTTATDQAQAPPSTIANNQAEEESVVKAAEQPTISNSESLSANKPLGDKDGEKETEMYDVNDEAESEGNKTTESVAGIANAATTSKKDNSPNPSGNDSEIVSGRSESAEALITENVISDNLTSAEVPDEDIAIATDQPGEDTKEAQRLTAPIEMLTEDNLNQQPILLTIKSAEAEWAELEAKVEDVQTVSEQADVMVADNSQMNSFRNTGLQLTGLSLSGGYLTDFTSDFYGVGGGLDLDIQRKGLLLNGGLHYYQLNRTMTDEIYDQKIVWDTTTFTYKELDSLTRRVDSTWVIRGPGQGGYIYGDTIRDSVFNVITETNIDSTLIQTKSLEEINIKVSYVEMPLLAGHRFKLNRFAVDAMGGVVLSQLTQTNLERTQYENSFGMDLILRPAVHYYFLPEWSVFGRASLRYNVVPSAERPQNFSSGFQLGLSYHW